MDRSLQSNRARSRLTVALALALIGATVVLLLVGPVQWALDERGGSREPDGRPPAELLTEKDRARELARDQPPEDRFHLGAPGNAAPGAFWTGAGLAAGGVAYLVLAGVLWRGSAKLSAQIVVTAVGGPLAVIWVVAGLWLLALAFSPNWGA